MEDVSYPVFSPRKPAASPAGQAPAPPLPADENIPLATPVAESRPLRADSTAFGPRRSLVRTTLKLVVFHWLNSMLGIAGFVVVVAGGALSLVLLPLCLVGLFVFRAVVYLVGVLAEMDVGLYNFISPPEEHVYVDIPRQAAAHGLQGERLSPQLSKLSSRTLLVSVYFATIKFGAGLLSSMALSIAFSLPVGAISRGGLGDSFHGFTGLIVFLIASALLLAVGIPLMFYIARLSRAATRYFCCERFSTYQFVDPQGGETTYGTTGAYANA